MRAAMAFLYHDTRMKASYIQKHHHSCWEIVYYLTGQGETEIGDTLYGYKANTFAIIKQGVLHDENRIHETEVIFAGFSFDEDKYMLPQGVFPDEDGAVREQMLRLGQEQAGKQAYYADKMDLLMEQLLIEISRSHSQVVGTHTLRNTRLAFARRYLDEHYQDKIHFAQMAKQYGYSYDRFRHLFKEETGLSPMTYLLGRRLLAAKNLLLQTEFPIATVASRAGFSSDVQLCALFKREMAMTPKQYRKSVF